MVKMWGELSCSSPNAEKERVVLILQLLSSSWGVGCICAYFFGLILLAQFAEGSRSSGGSVSLTLGRVFPPRTKFSFK